MRPGIEIRYNGPQEEIMGLKMLNILSDASSSLYHFFPLHCDSSPGKRLLASVCHRIPSLNLVWLKSVYELDQW